MAEKSLKDLSGKIVQIAENSKVIQKDVEEIRKAICGSDGLVSAMMSLSKNMEKGQGKKLSLGKGSFIGNKEMTKTLNNILKQLQKMSGKSFGGNNLTRGLSGDNFRDNRRIIDEKSGKLDRISKSIDLVERLKGIKLKDFTFARTKIKHIEKIISRSLNMFRNFKDKEEMENTISFVDSSIDLVKKLSKVSILSKPAQLGEIAIEKIMFGKSGRGGLFKVFKKLTKDAPLIEVSKKQAKNIAKICGSMVLVSIALTSIAALSIPAMLGAVVMSGIVKLLTATFKSLGKSITALSKGAVAMALLGTGVLAFSAGFAILRKATKDLKLKEVGVMTAAIAGTGVAVAGVGLLSIPIALGSGSLLLMGASLGVLGLALHAWSGFDSKPAMDSIKCAVGGLKDLFGLDLGKGEETKTPGQKLGGELIDVAVSVLQFGKSFFVMGSLLMAGASLGLLKVGISAWDNYDVKKSTENIRLAVGTIKDIFGLKDRTGEDIKGQLSGLGGDLVQLGASLLQAGSSLVQMGTLVLAVGMLDAIRVGLIPWENYDGKQASENISKAIGNLRTALGLNNTEEPKEKGFGVLLKRAGNKLADLGGTLIDGTTKFAELGSIAMAIGVMDVIRLGLLPWENYDGQKAISNVKNAITSASGICTSVNEVNKSMKDVKLIDFELKSKAVYKFFNNMGKVRIDQNNTEIPLKNSVNAINALDISKANVMRDIFKSFSNLKEKPFDKFTDAVNKFVKACNEMVDSIKDFENISNSSTTQSVSSEEYTVSSPVVSSGANINVQQITDAISQALKTLNVRLDPSMLDINLIAEGGYGKSVKLTLQD